MDEEILDKARGMLRQRKLRGALLSNPATITWLTGYAPSFLSGPSPFEAGGALAWIDTERVILIVPDSEEATAQATGAEIMTYPTYQIESPVAPIPLHIAVFKSLLNEAMSSSSMDSQIGYDSMPTHLFRQVTTRWSESALIAIDGWSEPLRAVKTASEIAKIRAACGLASGAHGLLATMAAKGELRGKSELDVFHRYLATMEDQAGERLTVITDCLAGLRTAGIGGQPTDATLQQGDPLLVDIVPRLNGYWGDSCNVYFAGVPSPKLRAYHAAAYEALERVIDAVKPGVPANQLDEIARSTIAKHGFPAYPHHTGHGLGAAWHEEPRICDYNNTLLEAGMIVALEPGVYVEGVGGVRLEHVLLVTPTSAEILTQHKIDPL